MAAANYTWSSITDKLPKECDAVLDIYKYASKPDSSKMTKAVHNYASSLINLWIKSFGTEHVLGITSTKNKINKLVKHSKKNRKSLKHKTDKCVQTESFLRFCNIDYLSIVVLFLPSI